MKIYNCFKHWLSKGTIYILSDLHFEDPDCKLIDPNWPTPDQQVKLINSKVNKNDTLIILGDVGEVKWVKQLKGYKVLITGNHDAGVSKYTRQKWNLNRFVDGEDRTEYFRSFPDFSHMSPKSDVMQRAFFDNKLFDEVYDGPLFISDKVVLSHEPIKLPFGINIHGHVHQGEKSISRVDEWATINVCADVVGFNPVRLDSILDEFKAKTLHRITINKQCIK